MFISCSKIRKSRQAHTNMSSAIAFRKSLVKFTCTRTSLLSETSSRAAFISTTSKQCLDQKWRKQRGLTINPNAYGPLTNLPDYSYADGRPTPLGVGQTERHAKQKQYMETVVRMSREVDFAVERHKKMEQEKKETRQRILDNKLKPKGTL